MEDEERDLSELVSVKDGEKTGLMQTLEIKESFIYKLHLQMYIYLYISKCTCVRVDICIHIS